MEIIPLEQTPAQSFGIVLNNQECRISLYTRGGCLYMDLYKDNEPVYLGSLCLDRMQLNPNKYRGFTGSLYFIDTEGKNDPDYRKFDERYYLVYEA